MKINPRFKSLIPPLAPDELSQLEANIIKDGCRDPLVVWNDTLIDGHNRLEICQRNNIAFKTSKLDFKDEDDACVWIIRNQFGRRNLQSFTRATLALKLEPLLKAKGMDAYRSTVGRPNKSLQKSATISDEMFSAEMANDIESRAKLNAKIVAIQGKHDTRGDLAKIANVSHDTIAKAKVIEAKASPEVKAALHSGETSINAEYKKLTIHVGQNSGENEWYTPPEFVDAARNVMGGIDCDPASSAIANRTVMAETFFTKEQDGTKQIWSGRVFMNPPYAQPLISQFSEAVASKFGSGEISQAVVLVNNATETAWFARMASQASAICFPASRIKFIDPSGNKSGAPLQGQAVLYFGQHHLKFCTQFAPLGFVCHVIRTAA